MSSFTVDPEPDEDLQKDEAPPVPFFSQSLDQTHVDWMLLVNFMINGIADGSGLYHFGCFVSMQTGNIIYFAIGVVDPDSGTKWIKAIISVAACMLGAFFFGHLYRRLLNPSDPCKPFPYKQVSRWGMFIPFVVQTLLMVVATLIVTLTNHGVDRLGSGSYLSWREELPLALLSFQCAGSVITSRALGLNGLTTAVLTTVYCDFMASPDLLHSLTHRGQRQKGLAIIFMFAGALLGSGGSNGLDQNEDYSLQVSLGIATGLKGFATIGWLVWPQEKVKAPPASDEAATAAAPPTRA